MSVEAASNNITDTSTAPVAADSIQRLEHALELRTALRLPRLAGFSLALLLAAPGAHALELGEATITSRLGQPLQVEIPYRTSANERLTPNCVTLTRPLSGTNSLPTYTNAGRITTRSNQIRISGQAPVREPLIGLNVRVNCETVPHIVRSYQLFVDPPTEIAQTMSGAAAPREARTAESALRPVPTHSAAPAAPSRQSARAQGKSGGTLSQGQTYLVVRGDTLSGIAARVAERPGTVWETVADIFAANPQAFTSGDVNLIEEGRSITIPVLDGFVANSDRATAETPISAPAIVATVETPTETATVANGPGVSAASEPVTTAIEVEAGELMSEPVVEPAAESPFKNTPFEPRETTATTGLELTVAEPQSPVESAADLSGTAVEDVEGTWSGWLTGLISIGAGLVLMLLLMVRRQRSPRPVPDFVDAAGAPSRTEELPAFDEDVDTVSTDYDISAETMEWTAQKPALPSTGHDLDASIIEANTFSMPEDRKTDLSDLDLELPAAEMNSLDMDIGSPVTAQDSVQDFVVTTEEDPLDASVIIETHVGTELSGQIERSVKSGAFASGATPEETGMTQVELDMLRLDYESELTQTQELSQELRAAVADLEATRSAGLETGIEASVTMTQIQEMDEDSGYATETDVFAEDLFQSQIEVSDIDAEALEIFGAEGNDPTVEMPQSDDDGNSLEMGMDSLAADDELLALAAAELKDNAHGTDDTVEMPADQSDGDSLISDSQEREIMQASTNATDWELVDDETEKKTGSTG